jgi:CheY-like chemotaxis protein/anti-sigma regulatory factor (Ser/Thr protein kinase)
VPRVEADESRLTQVFLNLLMNAAHAFGPEAAAPEIRVVSAVRDDAVVVSIADNGDGMSETVRARLFEPFFTTRPQGQGTGLGMAVVQKILHELGGTIDVESAPGRGTTVRVTLRASARRSPTPPPHDAPAAHPRLRVLVVDDDPLVRRAMRRVLESQHEVGTVAGGTEAIQLLGTGAVFDVVLIDLMMDDMPGAELIGRIEREFSANAKQIVILTGGTSLGITGDFLSETRYPVLTKPIEPRVLLEAISRLGS